MHHVFLIEFPCTNYTHELDTTSLWLGPAFDSLNMGYRSLHRNHGNDACANQSDRSSFYNHSNSVRMNWGKNVEYTLFVKSKQYKHLLGLLTMISLFGFQYVGATLSATQSVSTFDGCALIL